MRGNRAGVVVLGILSVAAVVAAVVIVGPSEAGVGGTSFRLVTARPSTECAGPSHISGQVAEIVVFQLHEQRGALVAIDREWHGRVLVVGAPPVQGVFGHATAAPVPRGAGESLCIEGLEPSVPRPRGVFSVAGATCLRGPTVARTGVLNRSNPQ